MAVPAGFASTPLRGSDAYRLKRACSVMPEDPSELLHNDRLCALLRALACECSQPWYAVWACLKGMLSAFAGPTVKISVSPLHKWRSGLRPWTVIVGQSGASKSVMHQKLVRLVQLAEGLIRQTIQEVAPKLAHTYTMPSVLYNAVSHQSHEACNGPNAAFMPYQA